MSIREQVFVHEQGVLLDNELDADDARCWHWVAYASIGAPAAPANTNTTANARPDPAAKRGSTASRLAVATIRLVPPPHPPHPAPGSSHAIDNNKGVPAPTSAPAHAEPYVKLGRLATLKDFRKLGLGRLLVDTALAWAAAHGEEIVAPTSAARREAARVGEGEDGVDGGEWRGLVLVHAQRQTERWYARFGFERDVGMGVWDEEGIEHVGMWKRVVVKEKKGV